MRLKESHHSFTSTSIIAWITASRAFFLNVIFLQWGAEHLANYAAARILLLYWLVIDCKPTVSINALENTVNINKETKLFVRFP